MNEKCGVDGRLPELECEVREVIKRLKSTKSVNRLEGIKLARKVLSLLLNAQEAVSTAHRQGKLLEGLYQTAKLLEETKHRSRSTTIAKLRWDIEKIIAEFS